MWFYLLTRCEVFMAAAAAAAAVVEVNILARFKVWGEVR